MLAPDLEREAQVAGWIEVQIFAVLSAMAAAVRGRLSYVLVTSVLEKEQYENVGEMKSAKPQ